MLTLVLFCPTNKCLVSKSILELESEPSVPDMIDISAVVAVDSIVKLPSFCISSPLKVKLPVEGGGAAFIVTDPSEFVDVVTLSPPCI